jgi:hypothetical protein
VSGEGMDFGDSGNLWIIKFDLKIKKYVKASLQFSSTQLLKFVGKKEKLNTW